MKQIIYTLLVFAMLVALPPNLLAVVVVSDMEDFIDFTFDGLENGSPLVYNTGVIINGNPQFASVDKFLTLQFGTSTDLTAIITNVSDQDLSFILSNPPTAIDPILADVILGGQNAAMVPVNMHFGGGPVFNFAGLQNGNGTIFNLGQGESFEYIFGHFNSANLVLDGNLNDSFFIFDRIAQQSVAFNDNLQLTEFLLNEPFAVRFTAIPEPSTLLLLSVGLLGLIRRQKLL